MAHYESSISFVILLIMSAPFSILVFNAGSSSLKFALFDGHTLKLIVRGVVADIGGLSALSWRYGTTSASVSITIKQHDEAAYWVLDWLQQLWPFGSLLKNVGLIVHRVVHGGSHFYKPVMLTHKNMLELEQLSPLAPLHNPQALAVINATQAVLTQKALSFAVFDTAFFRNLPAHTGYALPESLLKQHDIQRFGFHGLAHRYMIQRYCALHTAHAQQRRIISFQLGNGCSVTAYQEGKPVDTSMGFTPLEGLMMATRAGDIDPGLLIYLLRNGHSLDELEDQLQHHSGLSAIAKSTANMQQLLEMQDTDKNAKLAIDMFCYRARKYLGAYMAVLSGVDAIIFGGGIGEHSAEIRQRICANMAWCGLVLDDKRNQLASTADSHVANDTEALISSNASSIRVYVISVNEELMMAEDARAEFFTH
jgi:acetate kinase